MRLFSARRLFLLLFVLLIPFTHGTAGAQASQNGYAPVAVGRTVDQQAPSDKLRLVRQAFDLLYSGYVDPLSSDILLGDAWDGVNNALTAAGLAGVQPPQFTGDPDADWASFADAFHSVVAGSGVSPTELAYGADNQMASARNSCHTAFLRPDQAAIENGSLSHQPTVDTGLVAGRKNNVVYRVYPGSPADQAGVQPGDILLSSAGQGDPGIRRRIFTQADGKPIPVTVQRPGVRNPILLSIVPEVTVLPFIRTAILPGGIGVIQWDDFTTGAGQVAAIRQALNEFEAQRVVGWILDLRTSPGGDSHTEAAIASLFLSGGRLTTLIDRAGGRQVINADSSATLPVQRPLVVLTEKFSASAADILPGILQDDGRAYLIGETTDGCISSSRIAGLADGSELQVEVERVLIGNDDLDLDGTGITPNETIIRTPEILASGADPQLDRAVQYLHSAAGQ